MNPLTVRSICGTLLVICATVTLGISAHVEHSSRSFGIKSSTFTYDAFVGAFTLAAELIFVGIRLGKPNWKVVSLMGEAALAGILWVLWIAAGISTTLFTEESRSICKHLDDLFELPELGDLDAATLAAAKTIFQNACSELHAELAFIWIGFIVTTFILGYTIYISVKNRRQGITKSWDSSFMSFRSPHTDPFADPEGGHTGHTVGVANVVDPNEEIVRR